MRIWFKYSHGAIRKRASKRARQAKVWNTVPCNCRIRNHPDFRTIKECKQAFINIQGGCTFSFTSLSVSQLKSRVGDCVTSIISWRAPNSVSFTTIFFTVTIQPSVSNYLSAVLLTRYYGCNGVTCITFELARKHAHQHILYLLPAPSVESIRIELDTIIFTNHGFCSCQKCCGNNCWRVEKQKFVLGRADLVELFVNRLKAVMLHYTWQSSL